MFKKNPDKFECNIICIYFELKNYYIYAFHEKHCDQPKLFTLNHFAAEGVPRSALFDILKRKEDGISSERQRAVDPLKT